MYKLVLSCIIARVNCNRVDGVVITPYPSSDPHLPVVASDPDSDQYIDIFY